MKIKVFSVLWCPSCIIMRPRYNEIKEKNTDISFEEFDFDEEREIFDKYNIGKVLPVLVLFDEEDKEILRIVGEKSKKALKKELGDRINV